MSLMDLLTRPEWHRRRVSRRYCCHDCRHDAQRAQDRANKQRSA